MDFLRKTYVETMNSELEHQVFSIKRKYRRTRRLGLVPILIFLIPSSKWLEKLFRSVYFIYYDYVKAHMGFIL